MMRARLSHSIQDLKNEQEIFIHKERQAAPVTDFVSPFSTNDSMPEN